jgi:hypothetical protein
MLSKGVASMDLTTLSRVVRATSFSATVRRKLLVLYVVIDLWLSAVFLYLLVTALMH